VADDAQGRAVLGCIEAMDFVVTTVDGRLDGHRHRRAKEWARNTRGRGR
jgi:hypothetical protein